MSIDNLDRRLNHIAFEMQEVEHIIHDWREVFGRDHFSLVPWLKRRARLRREQESITVLKNKRENEKRERKAMLSSHNRR